MLSKTTRAGTLVLVCAVPGIITILVEVTHLPSERCTRQAPKDMATSAVFRAEVDSENPWVASCRVGVPYDLDRAYKVTTKALLRIFELGRTATAIEMDWCGLKSSFQRGSPWLLKAQEVLIYPSAAKAFIPQVMRQPETRTLRAHYYGMYLAVFVTIARPCWPGSYWHSFDWDLFYILQSRRKSGWTWSYPQLGRDPLPLRVASCTWGRVMS